jgi:hypothetical protein
MQIGIEATHAGEISAKIAKDAKMVETDLKSKFLITVPSLGQSVIPIISTVGIKSLFK